MKKLIFAAALLVSCFTVQFADAQLRISLGLNIGSQPDWGPVGYDHAEYYYMPDIDAYYSVPTHEFVYFDNNRWIHANALPPRYANYDLYHSYKVVVNQANPWQRADYYRSHYASYRGHGGQSVIRDSRDARYQNHWQGDRGRGNAYGHDNGNWHGNGNGGYGNGRGNGNYGHGQPMNNGNWHGNGQPMNNGQGQPGNWHGNGQQPAPGNGNYNRGQGNGQPAPANNGQPGNNGQGNGNWHGNGHGHDHGGE